MKSILLGLLLVTLSSAYLVEFSQTYYGQVTQTGNSTYFSRTTLARAPVQQTFTYTDPEYGVVSSTQLIDIQDRESYWHSYFLQVDNLWSEVGNLTFGFFGPNFHAHRVFFVLDGYSRIDEWHNFVNGAGYANITNGEGFFKGADGRFAFTSTFDYRTSNWVGRVNGVFWVPSGPPPSSSSSLFNVQHIGNQNSFGKF